MITSFSLFTQFVPNLMTCCLLQYIFSRFYFSSPTLPLGSPTLPLSSPTLPLSSPTLPLLSISITLLPISRSYIHTISSMFPFFILLFTPALPLLFLSPFLNLSSPLPTLHHESSSSSSSFSYFPHHPSSSLNLTFSSSAVSSTPIPPHNISLSNSLPPLAHCNTFSPPRHFFSPTPLSAITSQTSHLILSIHICPPSYEFLHYICPALFSSQH